MRSGAGCRKAVTCNLAGTRHYLLIMASVTRKKTRRIIVFLWKATAILSQYGWKVSTYYPSSPFSSNAHHPCSLTRLHSRSTPYTEPTYYLHRLNTTRLHLVCA